MEEWLMSSKAQPSWIKLNLTETATLFGYSPQPNGNLAGQSCRKKLLINLIKEKNFLLAQINSSSFPEKKITLDHLLLRVRSLITPLCETKEKQNTLVAEEGS